MSEHVDPSAIGLAWSEKLQRCYYRAIGITLDRGLLDYVLVESYGRFREAGEAYPFVRPAELRPGGVGEVTEYAHHNAVLVLLLESELDPALKSNIRARRPQEVVQRNLQRYLLRTGQSPERVALIRDIESRVQLDQLRPLFSLDYGLLIQPRTNARDRLNYAFTHFHVKIDEVLDRVIEAKGIELRYLSKHLYEHGEDYAAALEDKFFESYGMKATASGRRTAAITAHALLERNRGLHTIYVGSTEARSLIKIESGETVSRAVLIEIDGRMRRWLAKTYGLTVTELAEHYAIADADPPVGILAVRYRPTPAAQPPADRKLRTEINAAERWTSIVDQMLMPRPDAASAAPLPVSWIYKR